MTRILHWTVLLTPLAIAGCLCAGMARGQCRSGYCATAPTVVWEWRELPHDPGRVHLYRNGVQVGGLDLEHGYFRPFDQAAGWGPSSADSAAAKRWAERRAGQARNAVRNGAAEAIPGASAARRDEPLTGVVWERIGDAEQFVLSGRQASRQVAEAVMASLPTDWAGKCRLTVIGSGAERQRVLADLKGHPLASECLVQDYDPGDPRESWAVEGVGFPLTFGVILQAPDGRVLARATRYEGRATLDAIEQIRRPRPDYDPAKDPDPHRRPGDKIPWIPLAGLAVLGLLTLLLRR